MFWSRKRRQSVSTPIVVAPRWNWIHGRRHLTESPYVLPNDVEDANRLDFQHFYLKSLLKGNYWAPIRRPRAILDVAGGTGRWALEMAQQFPDAHVVCLDIVSPPNDYLQTNPYGLGRIPPNFAFVEHDMFKGLPFADSSFDFVHMRMTFSATPAAQWQPLIQELVRVTRRGGWVESVEGSTFRYAGPAIATRLAQEWVKQLAAKRGIDPTYGQHVAELFRSAGLRNIYAREANLVAGKKGGRLGIMQAKDTLSAFHAMGTAVTQLGIVPADVFYQTMQRMEAELDNGEVIWPAFQAIGQKL